MKSISRFTKRTDGTARKDSEVVEVSAEKKSPKGKSTKRRRRSRFRKKSTPSRNESRARESSDPENEETNEGIEDAEEIVSGNVGETGETMVHNGHDDVVLGKSKELDVDSAKTLRFV